MSLRYFLTTENKNSGAIDVILNFFVFPGQIKAGFELKFKRHCFLNEEEG